MDAGELDTRVKVCSLKDRPKPDGSLTTNKEVIIITYANIKDKNTLQYKYGEQVKEGVTHKMKLRYSPTITTQHLIVTSDAEYKILGAIHSKRGRYTVLDAEQITGI